MLHSMPFQITDCLSRLACCMALFLTAGACEETVLAMAQIAPQPSGYATQQFGDAPPLHAPPVASPGSPSLWSRLWNGWGSSRTEIRLPQDPGPQPSFLPAQPQPDETEAAIREIRQRVGGVGESFSDLLSPTESQNLFTAALQRVRQDQSHQAPTPYSQPNARPQHSPDSHGVPSAGNYPSFPSAAPQPYGANHSYSGPQGNPQQLSHSPQQIRPQFPMNPQANHGGSPNYPPTIFSPGLPPGQNAPPGMIPPATAETEQAAVRRIARQLDQMAEELEMLKRYNEADTLRRYAQELRTAVR